MGASMCCAVADAYTQFTILALSALKKKCLIFEAESTALLVCRRNGLLAGSKKYLWRGCPTFIERSGPSAKPALMFP
jgi:hypothetical protein